jgi:hypothetical protein
MTTAAKKILIFQVSHARTGSTFLVNALHGLIENLKDVNRNVNEKKKDKMYNDNNNIALIKSHNIKIDDFIKKYQNNYNLLFVCTERKEKNLYIDEKYKSYKNVLVFDFVELNETDEYTIPMIIDTIYDKWQPFLLENGCVDIKLNKETAIERIINMNKFYEEIKDKPFTFFDAFFGIHGSHRNRDNSKNNSDKYFGEKEYKQINV